MRSSLGCPMVAPSHSLFETPRTLAIGRAHNKRLAAGGGLRLGQSLPSDSRDWASPSTPLVAATVATQSVASDRRGRYLSDDAPDVSSHDAPRWDRTDGFRPTRNRTDAEREASTVQSQPSSGRPPSPNRDQPVARSRPIGIGAVTGRGDRSGSTSK